MRGDVLIIIGITALVVAAVLLLGPTISTMTRGTPQCSKSTPLPPVAPQRPTIKPSTHNDRKVHVTARVQDALTGDPVRANVNLQWLDWRHYINESNVTDIAGKLDATFSIAPGHSASFRVEALNSNGLRYQTLSFGTKLAGANVDLGTLKLQLMPSVQFMARDGKRFPVRATMYPVKNGVAGKAAYRPEFQAGSRWLAVIDAAGTTGASPNGYYFIDYTAWPGLTKLKLPEPERSVIDTLPLHVITRSGVELEDYEYTLYRLGPYGIRLLRTSGKHEKGPLHCSLPAGRYHIIVRCVRATTSRSATFTIDAKGGMPPTRIVVPNLASVRVLITRSGMPVRGMLVDLEAGRCWFAYGASSYDGAYTNAQGEAFFGGLESGLYTLSGFGNRYLPVTVDAVEDQVRELHFDLDTRRGAVLRGHLNFQEAYRPIISRRLEFQPVDDDRRGRIDLDLDDGDCFEIRDIPPGEYKITAYLDGPMRRRAQTYVVRISDDSPVNLDLNFVLYSLNVSWPGHEGSLAKYVELSGPDTFSRSWQCEEGQDLNLVLHPGKYLLFAKFVGSGFMCAQVKIEDRDVHTVDWTYIDPLGDLHTSLRLPSVSSAYR